VVDRSKDKHQVILLEALEPERIIFPYPDPLPHTLANPISSAEGRKA
jgi:hypothetical protein